MIRFFLFAVLAVVMLACGNNAKQINNKEAATTETAIEQIERGVEVLYFHGKKRCVTCNAIEDLSKEVIADQFSEALQNGTLVFHSLDLSDPINEELVTKYEIAFSSLLVVVHKDGEEEVINLSELGFTKAKVFPEEFKLEFAKTMMQVLAKF